MGGSQFTMTLWMGLGQTTKNDNGYRTHSRFPRFAPIPCMGSWWTGTPPNLQDGGRCRIRPWRNTEYVPGRQFAIFIQVSNRGRFCQYISLPMKYTVSGSTLQYKVGLTLSFLSLISRGVGGIQNCHSLQVIWLSQIGSDLVRKSGPDFSGFLKVRPMA